MELSIVLGTYNRIDQIKDCVESVLAQTTVPFTLYITDAGSTDGTVEYLQSITDKRVVPILVGERIGQARAYNDVYRQVTSPYVCWISDDNIIHENGLDKGVFILRNGPDIGMVALKVRDRRGPFTDAPYIGGLSTIGILNVNQGMLPTAVMKKVGGFSEKFRDYGIDPDLTAKVLMDGWKVVYTRDVAILHDRNWSTEKGTPEYEKMWERQKRYLVMYEEKYGGLKAFSPSFLLKKVVWRSAQKLMPRRLNVNARETILGALPRDWNNMFCGRYISILDNARTKNELHHLVQRIPEDTIRRLNWQEDEENRPLETAAD